MKSGKGASQGTLVGPGLAKTDRDRAAGVEEELVDLPAWSAEEDEEEKVAGAAPAPEPELAAVGGAVGVPAAEQDLGCVWPQRTNATLFLPRELPLVG
eukprot:SAG25_NODE_3403_length_1095_cov_1.605422_2_plen_98_part_00